MFVHQIFWKFKFYCALNITSWNINQTAQFFDICSLFWKLVYFFFETKIFRFQRWFLFKIHILILRADHWSKIGPDRTDQDRDQNCPKPRPRSRPNVYGPVRSVSVRSFSRSGGRRQNGRFLDRTGSERDQ